MRIPKSVLVIVASLGVAGCGAPDRVLFVTTTAIGISADAKTRSANIGYDRYEVFVGPSYEKGGVPPVYARIVSDLNILNPKIIQLYATGDAARLATGGEAKDENKLKGSKRIMFFGTGTNFGLRAAFTPQGPDSINIGYRRQEFSLIPIGKAGAEKTGDKEDVYPSVLAKLNLNVDIKTTFDNKVGLSQFFATGDAAETLAKKPSIQQLFADEAANALGASIVECVVSTDENTTKIKNWIESSNSEEEMKERVEKLEAEIEKISSKVDSIEFLTCEEHADKRSEVVNNLKAGGEDIDS